jgi:hypothetical protein
VVDLMAIVWTAEQLQQWQEVLEQLQVEYQHRLQDVLPMARPIQCAPALGVHDRCEHDQGGRK